MSAIISKLSCLVLTFIGSATVVSAQEVFTRRDSLRGGLPKERICYDVMRYDLDIKINTSKRSLSGFNDISFVMKENSPRIQLDLFQNMTVDSLIFQGKRLNYTREYDAVFVDFPQLLTKDTPHTLRFYYSGLPTVARRAPWDGGFVFTQDRRGKDWIGVAVQGTGASLWYPCKDSQSDEPDLGASIKVAVPDGLMCVSNGRMKGSSDLGNGYKCWEWQVTNPINNYNITVNIGDYVHFGENYKGLDLDYYVLRDDEEKAKKQFEQVKPMLDCFQEKFGAYPFPEDGYKLVQTPYLGMEHQSAIAYGNHFANGYLGGDLSGTGKGLLFDFIIIHESGHEWFGNSIGSKDIADMWIHEAFTCYSESVYLECLYGKEPAQEYVNGLKKNVQFDKPVTGKYNVAHEGSSDMYYKGALMLNTLRHVIADDALWWKILKHFAELYRHQVIDRETVINFFNQESDKDLSPIFKQYLDFVAIPELELKIEKKHLLYRWKSDVQDFCMPLEVIRKGKTIQLKPTTIWQRSDFRLSSIKEIKIPSDRYFITIRSLK